LFTFAVRPYLEGVLGEGLGKAGHSRHQQRKERHGNRRQDLEIILRQAETFITQSKGFY
jgi:hypothetical protein